MSYLFKLLTLNSFNRNSEESIRTKLRRGSHGRIPDLSLVTKFEAQEQCNFIVEIKTPQFMSAIKDTDENDPDFVKLVNIMKNELDIMKGGGICFGALVQGKPSN
jgi:hypothetical protein